MLQINDFSGTKLTGTSTYHHWVQDLESRKDPTKKRTQLLRSWSLAAITFSQLGDEAIFIANHNARLGWVKDN